MNTYIAQLETCNKTPYSDSIEARFRFVAYLIFKSQNKGGKIKSIVKLK